MSFVVVPVASGVATLLALMGLLACVPQHVPLQVHTLVAAVVADGALKGFSARMHPLVPLEISQVAAGIVTQVALVGFLAGVYSMVPLEVVEVGGGVVTLWALVWLLSAVGLHVTGQVVRVVGEEGAGSTGVNLVPSLSGASGCVLSEHLQGALCTYLGRRSVFVIQGRATQPTSEGEEPWGQGGRFRCTLSRLQHRC